MVAGLTEHGVELNQLVKVFKQFTQIKLLSKSHTEILTCPSLSPPTNGAITFTPGADNSNIGLGSVATYSCNIGYVLVGHTTRTCQSLYGGASAAWSGNITICQGIKQKGYSPVVQS